MLCRTLHLNNKQNKNTNPVISTQEYHLTQPCPSEEKQTNRAQHKSHPILLLLLLLSHFSHVWLCAIPQAAAYKAPPSLGFSRQEHWSGLPFPSPMHGSEKWKWSSSVVSDPERPHRLQPSRLLHPQDSPGKNTGVGCHFHLQNAYILIYSQLYFN